MRVACILVLSVIFTNVAAQTGPGGVGTSTNNVLWLRANNNVYTDAGVTFAADGNSVQQWNDQSGNAKNAIQLTTNQPVYKTSILNGQPAIRFTGPSSRILSAGVSTGNSASVWAVASWSALSTPNPGIIQASPSGLGFSTAGTDKVIGMWINSTSPFRVWGRGVQSNNTQVNFSNASGTTTTVNTPYIILSHYNSAATTMTQYVMGNVSSTVAYDGTLRSWTDFGIGNQSGTEGWTGDISEVIAFNSAVNNAQRIIVDNYLSAKYGLTLSSNDLYTMDTPANGDFDFNVGGIGRFSATEMQTDSQGSGFVRISNPTDLLSNNEYFFWGHNSLAAQATNTTDIPAGYGITGRFARVWRVSEVGEVGNVDVAFDVTGLPDFTSLSTCDAASSIRLLIDTNNDGNFADQTPISGATNIGGNVYRFANVSALNNNFRFTIAIVATSVTGPGGVGGTNGITNLKLWLDAGKGVTSASSVVSSWTDQSGNSITATAAAPANRPTIVNNVLNTIQPVINFSAASSQYLQLSSNVNTTTPTAFIVANKTSVGATYMTMLTLQSNLWLGRGNSTDQWGMYLNADVLSGTTLGPTYRILTTSEKAFNNVDFFTNETFVNLTTGTALHGKGMGTIAANNSGTSGSGFQFFDGNIAEIAIYNTNLNTAQRIIVDNYLAAKYGLALTGNDIYTQDNGSAPNNFDFDVAGIGRFSSTELHSDARGTGIVRISNPTSLGDGDYLLWGHNNLPLVANTVDVPTGLGVQAKFQRIWAVNEVNEVGAVDLQFDLTGQSPVTASDLRLLIDPEGNGVFNEGTTTVISGAIALSCNNYLFSGVPAASLGDNMRFTLGTANKINTPLPIELTSFYGTIGENGVDLNWATATEHNSYYFLVERSLDGEKFSEILQRPAAGTSTEQRLYTATDVSAPAGKLYYRLKAVDYDNSYTYSKIIAIDNPFAESRVVVSPNPVKIGNDLEVRILNTSNLDPEKMSFTLFDMLGRQVATPYQIKESNVFSLKTSATPAAGFYILKVKSSDWTREFVQRVLLTEQ